MKIKTMSAYQVAVAAESMAAALFARAGCHISVQYGPNQPGYDLIAEKEGRSILVSVKGSQDNAWGLNQSHLKNANYRKAVDDWFAHQPPSVVICFVQFFGTAIDQMPTVYLATSQEVADHLRQSGGGLGDTVLHIAKTWKTGQRHGHTDTIPPEWTFSTERVDALINGSAAHK
jgi:hypothetical protein